LSASAVRFRLGRQLDWRIDLILDATGLHLLSLRGLYVMAMDGSREIETLFEITVDDEGNKASSAMRAPTMDGEIIVRSEAILKLPHTPDPLFTELDLRLRDYISLPPAEPNIQRKRDDAGTQFFEVDMRGSDFLPDRDTPKIGEASERLRELPGSTLSDMQRMFSSDVQKVLG
jgi:hypothetical protein